MPHQVTVTGKVGPDRALVNHVLPAATKFTLDLSKKVLSVEIDPGPQGGSNVRDIDLAGVASFLVTITAGQYAIVVS